MRMTIGEREVGRVVGHGVPLTLNTHPHVRQGEVCLCGSRNGNPFYRITLRTVGSGIQRIIKSEVGVKRIIGRPRFLLGDRVVERCRYLCLVGEEFSQLQTGCHTISLIVVCCPLVHPVLYTSKTLRDVTSLHINRPEVGELHIKVTLCRPSPMVIVFFQTQLVHPHFARFGIARFVAHTNHNRLDFPQRRITHHTNPAVRIVAIIHRILTVVGRHAQPFRLVARFLHLGKQVERHIKHVCLRPHPFTVIARILVVHTRCREHEWHLIFIVVGFIITSQAYEHRQLLVGKLGVVRQQGIGMHKHLQAFVRP